MRNEGKAGIVTEQWGGRKNRYAPDCATHKLVTMEYACYVKATIALFFGDVASNFDRLLANITSITSQNFGMEKSVCICKALTQQN